MATTTMRPFPNPGFFVKEESVSLRSFRLKTSPPSIKASSLASPVRGRTLQNFIHSEADDTLIPKIDSSTMAIQSTQTGPTLQRPSSKSRTIIRMLTTRFTPRQRSTSSSPSRIIRAPPTIPNAFGKEERDAALRARGLLPPLPQSMQEKEQDRLIPIVRASGESEKTNDPNQPSAADLIKKEWAAKNKDVERERMGKFKFGGGGSPLDAQFPLAEGLAPTAADHVAEDPPNDVPVSLPLVATTDEQARPHPTPSPKSSIPPAPPWLLDISPQVQSWMFPLPPSPSSSLPKQDIFSQPSPSLRSIPDTQITAVDPGSGTNTPRPPDGQRELTPTPTPLPGPPAISLTPPADYVSLSFKEPEPDRTRPTDESPTSPTSAAASHMRTDSVPSFATSVPSLDATNSTATTTTRSTSVDDSVASLPSNSNANATATAAATATVGAFSGDNNNNNPAAIPKGKLGGLTVRTHGAPLIPVIIQSPVVDGAFLDVVVEEPSPMDINHDADGDNKDNKDEKDEKKLTTALLTPPQSPQNPRSPRTRGFLNSRKRRGVTDPTTSTGTVDRKKSLNPFRRGVTLDSKKRDNKGNDPSSTGAELPQRRSSVVSSFSNIRRSVVGTLSSSRKAGASGELRGRRFDASLLPPSPTAVPSSFRGISIRSGVRSASRTSGRSSGEVPSSPRQAVAPVVHTQGSILMEMNNIEDEETRIRTEMAFLS